jgi:phosphatidylglycerol:prolipoprotein diacylglycerol transferase
MYPPVDPILVHLGPLALRWYGLLMVTSIFVGATLASREIERQGQDGNDLWDMLVWVLIPALIGARLYYVFIQSPRNEMGIGYYLSHPVAILQIWSGGIHIFGAFIVGGIAVWLYLKIRQLPLWIFLDGVSLGLPLAQAIGRWGNFINQELYGPPTTLPWGLYIDRAHRIPPYDNLAIYPDTVQFHPLFLYESLWNLLGFALLFWVSRHFAPRLKPGDLTLLYFIWYPLGRFWLEFLRTDSWFFAGTPFNVVHIFSFISVVVGIIALKLRHSKTHPNGSALSED